MSKILGLDYGKKRCGISISDELQIIASPLTTIDTKKLMDFLNINFLIIQLVLFGKENLEDKSKNGLSQDLLEMKKK